MDEKTLTRFWARVKRGAEDECWLPKNPVRKSAYICLDGRSVTLPRAAWVVTNGPVPAGYRVTHICDERTCCNPTHLTLGLGKGSGTDSRFWAMVNKNGPVPEHMSHLGKCWVWTAGKDKNGYGIFDHGRAHRFSYEMHFHQAPGKLLVCHHCDNPSCVRPEHLFLGTASDNTLDAVAKGRMAHGDRNASRLYPERRPRGSNHPRKRMPECWDGARGDAHWTRRHPERILRGASVGTSKLTEDDVREIRRLRSVGITIVKLGAMFGITHRMVSAIALRQSWRHVP